MMDLRKRIFIISSIVVLGVLAIVLVLVVPREPNVDVPDFDPNQPDATDDADDAFVDDTLDLPPVIGDPTAISPILANEDAGERYVRQLAIDFVERFGSFSNQNKNAHIQDVLPLATAAMAGWIETQGQAYSDEYQGSTTKVIVSDMESYSDTEATVHVEAQQAFETLTDVERVYYAGTVKLVNENGKWKVSGLFWDK